MASAPSKIRLSFSPCKTLQPRHSEYRVNPHAIDRHWLILIQVHCRRQAIVLISLVPYQGTQLHMMQLSFHNFLLQRLVTRSHEQQVSVRPIRGREIRQNLCALFEIRGAPRGWFLTPIRALPFPKVTAKIQVS